MVLALLLLAGCGKKHPAIDGQLDKNPGVVATDTSAATLRGSGSDQLHRNARDFLDAGGTRESEWAVHAGLKWLAAHQAKDGSWSMHRFHEHGGANLSPAVENCGCTGAGWENDMAATAFALWPFIAKGESHRGTERTHKYSKLVEQGMKFLVSRQKPDGDLRGQSNDFSGMYTQGLCTIVLCELLTISGNDPDLTEPCRKAVDFIVKAQHEKGGWRYKPGELGDMSVTSWQVMALKSARQAGLEVPSETLEKAASFIRDLSEKDGTVHYHRNEGGGLEDVDATKPPPRAPMTAAGLLCQQYLADRQQAITPEERERGVKAILASPPSEDAKNTYYWYYATQAVFNTGTQNEMWQQWNPTMRDLLVRLQDHGKTEGHEHEKGSWSPDKDMYQGEGGRIMQTSLSLLTLEIYYRFLSTNRREIDNNKFPDGRVASSP